jgi:hypothetical protein
VDKVVHLKNMYTGKAVCGQKGRIRLSENIHEVECSKCTNIFERKFPEARINGLTVLPQKKRNPYNNPEWEAERRAEHSYNKMQGYDDTGDYEGD